MRILAFDTSFEACSAAIVEGERTLWSEQRLSGRGHAEVLPAMVAEGLRAIGINVGELDRIGVVVGPGAFAGVRVGVAFARGLCLGVRARAVGVTSLKALAASADAKGLIAPIFDARRGQVYAALYDATLRERIEPFVAAPEEAARRLMAGGATTLAGSGAVLVAPHMTAPFETLAIVTIDPAAVARLVLAAEVPQQPPSPLYLRPPDAAASTKGRFEGLLS